MQKPREILLLAYLHDKSRPSWQVVSFGRATMALLAFSGNFEIIVHVLPGRSRAGRLRKPEKDEEACRG